jgi:hypothetical protein
MKEEIERDRDRGDIERDGGGERRSERGGDGEKDRERERVG